MTVHLEPGTFYAGVSLPFFITESLVKSKVEAAGLTNVVFHKRSESSPPVNVMKYPGYSDDWDTWISADYDGPKKDLDIAKHWAWLLVVPKGAEKPKSPPPPPPAPTSAQPSQKQALIALGVLSGFALLMLHWSQKSAQNFRVPSDPLEEEPKDDG